MQAARLLATLIVYGSGAVIRACTQAYRQALASICLFLITIFLVIFFFLFGSFCTNGNRIVWACVSQMHQNPGLRKKQCIVLREESEG